MRPSRFGSEAVHEGDALKTPRVRTETQLPSSGNTRSDSASASSRTISKPLPYVVLTGNPNCGKTTLFNTLTGLRAKVGNYAGVIADFCTQSRERVEQSGFAAIRIAGQDNIGQGF